MCSTRQQAGTQTSDSSMGGQISENLQKKLTERLSFYEDLGIQLFYLDRSPSEILQNQQQLQPPDNMIRSNQIAREEPPLPKTPSRPAFQKVIPAAPKIGPLPLPAAPRPSLFDATDRIVDDTLLRIRQDLGECTRCKLHKHRHTIVFGDGNAKAELVFVGEGPGADEDAQGLPFVGRAGKLLTQMIEAMGLQRKDV